MKSLRKRLISQFRFTSQFTPSVSFSLCTHVKDLTTYLCPNIIRPVACRGTDGTCLAT